MRFPIRPGKVTCAGIVAILMVLPNSIWKGPDAKVAPPVKTKIQKVEKKNGGPPVIRPVYSTGRTTTYPSTYEYGVTPASLLSPSVSRIVTPHGSVKVADITPSSGSRP
jgi:hypothetical protein